MYSYIILLYATCIHVRKHVASSNNIILVHSHSHYPCLLFMFDYPYQRNGVVRYESVMMLRNKLDELGKMEGFTEKEKGETVIKTLVGPVRLSLPVF